MIIKRKALVKNICQHSSLRCSLLCFAALFFTAACRFNVMKSLTEGTDISGERLVSVYGCVNCHEIDGASTNPGNIGPPLTGWQKRKYIAGRVPNTPSELIRWIQDPQSIDPGTAMPDLGVTKDEATKMAAYLYSQ